MVDRVPYGYFQNIENVKSTLKKCKTIEELNNNYTAVKMAKKFGFYEEFAAPLRSRKSRGYWENVNNIEYAFKECKSIKELRRHDRAIVVAKELGIYEGLVAPIRKRKPNGFYTKEYCRPYALKVKSRTEFQKTYPAVFDAARAREWLDDICSHYKPPMCLKKRAIYAIEFLDHSVYVGLTWNYKERFKNRKSSRDKVQIKMECTPYKIIEFNEWHPPEIAAKKEATTIQEYRSKNWRIINQNPAGALGASKRKWTEGTLKKLFLKYDQISKLKREYSGAYSAAIDLGLLKKLSSHMQSPMKRHGFWNEKSNVQKVANKCKTRTEFFERFPSAHQGAIRNNYLEDVCSHMQQMKLPNGYWNDFERCEKEAQKFKSKTSFKIHSRGAENAARKNGWINEICSHMN